MHIVEFFSVNTTFFTILNYPMSYIEFFGTIFSLWSVWLVVRNNVLTWPVGLVGIILFLFLFYQIQLYSDLVEQIFYIGATFYGWFIWLHPKTKREADEHNQLKIKYNSKNSNIIYIATIVVGTLFLGYTMSKIHILLPHLFSAPASFPYLDAFTTVMSFAATILMAKKKINCWYLWILVDIIGIVLYYNKGTIFLSLLYLIFLILATKGYFDWKKLYFTYKIENHKT
jgi:nicotinamide mononucleotide transporter